MLSLKAAVLAEMTFFAALEDGKVVFLFFSCFHIYHHAFYLTSQHTFKLGGTEAYLYFRSIKAILLELSSVLLSTGLALSTLSIVS